MKLIIDRTTPIADFLREIVEAGHPVEIVESDARFDITELDLDQVLLESYHRDGEDRLSVSDKWRRMGAVKHRPLDIFCMRAMWEKRELLADRFRQVVGKDPISLEFDGTIIDQDGVTQTGFMRFSPGSGRFYCGTFFLKHPRGVLNRAVVVPE